MTAFLIVFYHLCELCQFSLDNTNYFDFGRDRVKNDYVEFEFLCVVSHTHSMCCHAKRNTLNITMAIIENRLGF